MKTKIVILSIFLGFIALTTNAQEILRLGERVHYLPEIILTSTTNSSGGLNSGTATAVADMDSYEWIDLFDNSVVGDEQTVSDLPAGDYQLTVVYYNCPKDTIFTITDSQMEISTNMVNNSVCPGGDIDIIVTGIGLATYEFSIDGSVVQLMSATSIFLLENLTVNVVVDVRVIDQEGAELTGSIEIIVYSAPSPDEILTDTTLPTGTNSDGTATAIAGMASYEWTNTDNNLNAGNDQIAIDLPAGNYMLLVTTDDGCEVDTTFSLVSVNAPIIIITSDADENTVCAADVNLIPEINNSVEITVDSEDDVVEYQFSIGGTVVQTMSATNTYLLENITSNTIVNVEVIDNAGVSGFGTIEIIVNPLPLNQDATVNSIVATDDTIVDRGECEPVTIFGLEGSQVGYRYRLQDFDTDELLEEITGAGSAFEFSGQAGRICKIIIVSPAGCSRPVTK